MPPPRTSTSAVLSCTPKRLFLVVLCLFAVILLTEVLMLPNLIGVAALPVPTTADNSAPDEGAQVAVAAPPASLRPVTGAPPNISVIMPCYGHVHFLEEALNSVIKQQYPPAEILVVDDGSPEECGKFASDMLDGSLASARRRQFCERQGCTLLDCNSLCTQGAGVGPACRATTPVAVQTRTRHACSRPPLAPTPQHRVCRR